MNFADELKHHIRVSGATFMCTSGRLSSLAVQLVHTTPLKVRSQLYVILLK